MRHTPAKVLKDDKAHRDAQQTARIAGLSGRDILVHEIDVATGAHRIKILSYGTAPQFGAWSHPDAPAFYPGRENAHFIALLDGTGGSLKIWAILREMSHQVKLIPPGG